MPIALPDSMLPVTLPDLDDFQPRTLDPNDGDSEPELPLGRVDWWTTVELDLGDGPKRYQRELNVMPQWAGSCWYELRYLDPTNENCFVDPVVERYWMGPQRPGDPAASISTSVASSTRCYTCSTAASGTRCCSTSATSRRVSRITVSSTRATSSRPRSRMRARSTSTRPRCVRSPTARSPTPGNPSRASSARWARA